MSKQKAKKVGDLPFLENGEEGKEEKADKQKIENINVASTQKKKYRRLEDTYKEDKEYTQRVPGRILNKIKKIYRHGAFFRDGIRDYERILDLMLIYEQKSSSYTIYDIEQLLDKFLDELEKSTKNERNEET